MNIMLILAHPDKGSFNHAIASVAADALTGAGHTVWRHDLYDEGFDPLLPKNEFSRGALLPSAIERHCRELETADGIVIVHPNWWGMPPAILTGWVDRVIRPGRAYEFVENDKGDGVPRGLLKARAAIVFNTSDTVEKREAEVFGDPLRLIWEKCIFDLCGVRNFHRRVFRVVVTSKESERLQWLTDTQALVRRIFPGQGN